MVLRFRIRKDSPLGMWFVNSVSVSPLWERLSLGDVVLKFRIRKDSPLGTWFLNSVLGKTPAFKLDELHGLSLKPAVAVIEPNSVTEIGSMKKWAMSTLARPGHMALVEDRVLFNFIAMKLMAQDESLAEESVVDEEFATFLARSNTV